MIYWELTQSTLSPKISQLFCSPFSKRTIREMAISLCIHMHKNLTVNYKHFHVGLHRQNNWFYTRPRLGLVGSLLCTVWLWHPSDDITQDGKNFTGMTDLLTCARATCIMSFLAYKITTNLKSFSSFSGLLLFQHKESHVQFLSSSSKTITNP